MDKQKAHLKRVPTTFQDALTNLYSVKIK